MTEVLLALSGLPDEPDLVRAAESVGLRIVRRCVDAVDLLAAAAIADGCPAVVSAGLPRLTPDVVARLGGRPVIGIAADALGVQRLERSGVDPVIVTAPAAQTTMQQVADVCAAARSTPAAGPAPDPVAPPAAPPAPTSDAGGSDGGSGGGPEEVPDPPRGRVIAVWGPLGSPGRTTIALGMAEQLAGEGHRVCLVDADTYGPSVTLALGLLEDASGLIVACRHADAGSLSPQTLASLTMTVPVRGTGQWRVLGGLPAPERWRELRRTALDRIWPAARGVFDATVVDVGFCLESDGETGAWARERNAAALSAVAGADHIVAVGDTSVVGAARLAGTIARLREVAPTASVSLIRNRARGSAAQWREAVGHLLPQAPVVDVPADERAVAACWARGRSLDEGARRSRIRRAMEQVAATAVSE